MSGGAKEAVSVRSEILPGRDSAEWAKARIQIGEWEPITVSYARLTTLKAQLYQTWAATMQDAKAALGGTLPESVLARVGDMTPEGVAEQNHLAFWSERAEARDDVGRIPRAVAEGGVQLSGGVIVWLAESDEPLWLDDADAVDVANQLQEVADTLAEHIQADGGYLGDDMFGGPGANP